MFGRFKNKQRRDVRTSDRVFYRFVWANALLMIVLLGALIYQVGALAQTAFAHFGFGFFTSSEWNPVSDEYGTLSFIWGTVVSSVLAIAIAFPISVGVALFLTEIANRKLSKWVGFLVEMLAAIPSVVYGLWGIFVLTPWLRLTGEPVLGKTLGFLPLFQGPPFGVGMLAAGMILAIMVIPTISTICREVFAAVPAHQREAALALGATRWEMIRVSVLKSSRTGILGAVVLGLGRALGETMAVTMIIGNRAEISVSLFAPAQTMASVIANEYAEATSDLHLSALAAVGIALFMVSFVINGTARWMTRVRR